MSGPTGTGKTTYAETKVREVARGATAPSDWCYVYNFDEPDRPTARRFRRARGRTSAGTWRTWSKRPRPKSAGPLKAKSTNPAALESHPARRGGGRSNLAGAGRGSPGHALHRPAVADGHHHRAAVAVGPAVQPGAVRRAARRDERAADPAGQELRGRVNDAIRRIRHVERANPRTRCARWSGRPALTRSTICFRP